MGRWRQRKTGWPIGNRRWYRVPLSGERRFIFHLGFLPLARSLTLSPPFTDECGLYDTRSGSKVESIVVNSCSTWQSTLLINWRFKDNSLVPAMWGVHEVQVGTKASLKARGGGGGMIFYQPCDFKSPKSQYSRQISKWILNLWRKSSWKIPPPTSQWPSQRIAPPPGCRSACISLSSWHGADSNTDFIYWCFLVLELGNLPIGCCVRNRPSQISPSVPNLVHTWLH